MTRSINPLALNWMVRKNEIEKHGSGYIVSDAKEAHR
jgi:hypothetical protein